MPKRFVAAALTCAFGVFGCHTSPTEPVSIPLSGVWTAHAFPLCSPIDLSTATLEIEQVSSDITGTLTGAHGHVAGVSGTVQNDTGVLQVALPQTELPCAISFRIDGVTRTPAGVPSQMQVVMTGRCCEGTVESNLEFTRVSGA